LAEVLLAVVEQEGAGKVITIYESGNYEF